MTDTDKPAAHRRHTHDVPRFEGTASRRHRAVPVWRLRIAGRALRVAGYGIRPGETRAVVQFAGFPRSGHSVVGAILDAHPDTVMAHELDVMGLMAKGVHARDALALAERNAERFAKNGRYWNGFCYTIPEGHGGSVRRKHVVGDKKGDRAIRCILADPGLVHRLRVETQLPQRWIVVVRNPYDNIATMALRRGRHYDRLRISNPDPGSFARALSERQGHEVPAAVEDAVIDDYEQLLNGLAVLAACSAPEDVTVIRHEVLCDRPAETITGLAKALDLAEEPEWVESAAKIIAPQRPSRHRIAWSEDQLDRVATLVRRHQLLDGYTADGISA